MKKALGDIIDPVSLQAMEVSAVMAQAGASQEEIEEMMAMILSQGTGVSQDFIESIKEEAFEDDNDDAADDPKSISFGEADDTGGMIYNESSIKLEQQVT